MKHPFDYHRPSEEQVKQIALFRDGCKALHALIVETLPDGREKSTTITKLEEVSMWGNKAIIMADEGEVAADPKHRVHFGGPVQGVQIGDNNTTSMTFGKEKP